MYGFNVHDFHNKNILSTTSDHRRHDSVAGSIAAHHLPNPWFHFAIRVTVLHVLLMLVWVSPTLVSFPAQSKKHWKTQIYWSVAPREIQTCNSPVFQVLPVSTEFWWILWFPPNLPKHWSLIPYGIGSDYTMTLTRSTEECLYKWNKSNLLLYILF